MPEWGRVLLGGVGCFLLAWLSLAMASGIDGSPLWLADALLIFLVLDRADHALAINLAAGALGMLLAYLLVAGPFVAPAVLVPVAGVLHAALARFLLVRFAPDAVRLATAGALVQVLLWTALLSPIAGAVVMAGVALSGDGSLPATQAFLAWWIASAVGTAVLLPFLLSLVHAAPGDYKLLLSRWREALLVLALVVLLAAIARHATDGFPSLLSLPVVLWAALRLDFRATSLLCVVVALLPMAVTTLDLWPQYDAVQRAMAPAEERQAYLLAIIVPALFASLFTEEQRASDRARQTTLQALRAIMDAVPLAIVSSTPDGKVSLWSRGAERVFGWRRSAVEGGEAPFVGPEHAAQDASIRQRVLAGNEIQNLPAQRRNDEGALRDLVINATPLRDPDNAIIGIISVMEDVTDRRRLEASREEQRAKLAAILDAVADPIITSDEDGTITSFSRAAEAVFGYSASEIIGCNLKILMPEPDHSRHEAYLRRYRETGVKRIIGTSRQVTARRKDGGTFPAEITISEAWLDGKRIFAGLVRDLSRIPSAKPAQVQVARADAGTAKFLSRITHDLRQPLHALSLMTGALERRTQDPDSREIVADLSRIVRSIQATFENIVEWTRLESGLVGTAPTAVPASEVLSSLAQEFAPEAARRGLAFRWVSSRAMIACDPVLLRRILRQFLDNAVKFTPSGKVLLGARRHGAMLRMIVGDTGVGIPADQRDFIFGEYNQLDPGREAGGLGLGLAIVRRLAELAGLTIGMRASDAKGSLFWVDVPLSTQR
ncbi:PAS domain S-box protein [Dongia deserti]|uniref:PAS domain S-box protein n=1 Tax=Dongia deserti TaxID=2268030 RepID=UPI000E65CBDC|nr:PAS domain S-box protein [Dongia deserti]